MEGKKKIISIGGYRESLPEHIKECAPRAFDIVGDIAILRIPQECRNYMREIGEALIRYHKNIKVVCNDYGTEDEYRIRKLEVIFGENRFETVHSEFGCHFKINLERVYFSPRLSTERWRIVENAANNEVVIDMFAGVGPFSILLAKYKRCKCISIDINPHAIALLRENAKLNKVEDLIKIICGDSRFVLKEIEILADRIIMNYPTNAFEFLDAALEKSKRGTVINYYSIINKSSEESEISRIKKKIVEHSFDATIKVRRVRETSPSKAHYAFDITLI